MEDLFLFFIRTMFFRYARIIKLNSMICRIITRLNTRLGKINELFPLPRNDPINNPNLRPRFDNIDVHLLQ